jgi:DNA-binding winged helix-turn-helix (wHTH) protein
MPNIKKIYFRLFGTFDIVVNKQSVLTKGVRQQGFNKLFIYFLLNHDRVFEINTLIDKVWPNKEYHDNNSIMRTQIFRLKRQLTELAPSLDFKLEFTHGGYCFTYDPKNVVMDTDIFESLCSKIFSSRQAASLGGDTENLSGFGTDQTSRAFIPLFSVGASGLQSSGPLSVPPIGTYIQGRADRLSNRPGTSYMANLEHSDSEIMKLCSDALRVYQSGFLNETAFDASWLESYRQNYRRMWLRIIEMFTLL